MENKKNASENWAGLDRAAEVFGVPFHTLNYWYLAGWFHADHEGCIKLLHGDKEYGLFEYNGIQFKVEYSRRSVNMQTSKLPEKLYKKYNE